MTKEKTFFSGLIAATNCTNNKKVLEAADAGLQKIIYNLEKFEKKGYEENYWDESQWSICDIRIENINDYGCITVEIETRRETYNNKKRTNVEIWVDLFYLNKNTTNPIGNKNFKEWVIKPKIDSYLSCQTVKTHPVD